MEDFYLFVIICVVIILIIFGYIQLSTSWSKDECKRQFGAEYYYVNGVREASFCFNDKTNDRKYLRY